MNKINFFYNSYLFHKLINYFVKHGKKEKVERTFEKIFLTLSRKGKIPVINYILNLAEIYKPVIGLRYAFKRKTLIMLPKPLTISAKYFLALKWIKEGVDGKLKKRTSKELLKQTRRSVKILEKQLRQVKRSSTNLIGREENLLVNERRYKIPGSDKVREQFDKRLLNYIMSASADPFSTYSWDTKEAHNEAVLATKINWHYRWKA